LTAAEKKAPVVRSRMLFPQICLPKRAARDGRTLCFASIRIDGFLSIGSAMPSRHKTNLRFYDAPLTLTVLVLPFALSHRAVSLVWNGQSQKVGQETTSLRLPQRANGSIANLPAAVNEINN
jgi:hypothetical protein